MCIPVSFDRMGQYGEEVCVYLCLLIEWINMVRMCVYTCVCECVYDVLTYQFVTTQCSVSQMYLSCIMW